MISRFAVLFLIITFGTALASASGTEIDITKYPTYTQKWRTLFPGRPFVVNPGQAGWRLLKMPDQCRPTAEAIFYLVKHYDQAAARSLSVVATANHKAIQAVLEYTQMKNPACLKTAEGAYLLASLAIFSGYRWDWSFATFDFGGVPRHLPIYLLGAHLINKNTVGLRDLEFFSGDPKMLGAYECSQGKIFLNRSLKPIDLAAGFVHELSHLYRDKFIKPNSSGDTKGTTQSYILIDEALSTVEGSFQQLRLRYPNPHRPSETYYNIKEDLNLFSDNGPLKSLYGETYEGWIWNVLDKYFFWPFTNGNHILRQDGKIPPENSEARPKDNRVLELFRRVYDAYFPGQVFQNEVLKIKSRDWQGAVHPFFLRYAALYETTQDKYGYDAMVPDDLLPAKQLTIGLTEAVFDEITALDKKLLTKSPSCEQFLRDTELNAIGSYIGNKYRLGGGGIRPTTPVHPGGGGIRPNTPVHPGGGIRPNTPVHPGGGGIRPTLPIRPCLELERKP